jgi:hypothetical protein
LIGVSEAPETVGMPDYGNDYDWEYPTVAMPRREEAV